MKDRLTISECMEYYKLWDQLKLVEKEYKSIYKEFDLYQYYADFYYSALYVELNDHCWLEAIDWATCLAQTTKLDLVENNIDTKVMNTLMISLSKIIEIANNKLIREIEQLGEKMSKIYNIGNGDFNNNSYIDFSTNKEIIKNNNITTNELEELYNKNKERINNHSFLKKIIKLFSKEEQYGR